MKIEIMKTDNYKIEGYLYSDQLTAKYVKLLEVDENSGVCDEIQVSGEYTVEFDEEIPMVQIQFLYFSNGNKDVEVDLDDLDLEALEQTIQDKGDACDWYSDRMASAADYYMDQDRD